MSGDTLPYNVCLVEEKLRGGKGGAARLVKTALFAVGRDIPFAGDLPTASIVPVF